MIRHTVQASALSDEAITACCRAFSLEVTVKTTQRTLPGSVHWHLKRGRLPGVLEVTWVPSQGEFWVEIHANRRAAWNEAISEEFARALAAVTEN